MKIDKQFSPVLSADYKRECNVQGHLEETKETVFNGMKEPKHVQSLCDIRLVDIE